MQKHLAEDDVTGDVTGLMAVTTYQYDTK